VRIAQEPQADLFASQALFGSAALGQLRFLALESGVGEVEVEIEVEVEGSATAVLLVCAAADSGRPKAILQNAGERILTRSSESSTPMACRAASATGSE
jgi:hypothetical protein